MSSQPRCFIISPIGAPGSTVRQHADDVFDYIIKPAVDECGVLAARSDHINEPGKISQQMLREIVGSNCCICILTGHNPNVFYELAIAQVVGTPVVILIERGQDLPFDVHDLRCVNYDLSPRPLFEGRYAREVSAHLRSLQGFAWTAPPLLSEADVLKRHSSLPRALVQECSRSFHERRDALSNAQRELLTLFENDVDADSPPPLDRDKISAAFARPHSGAELFYRLEQLRLLGFLERLKGPDGRFSMYCLTQIYWSQLLHHGPGGSFGLDFDSPPGPLEPRSQPPVETPSEIAADQTEH